MKTKVTRHKRAPRKFFGKEAYADFLIRKGYDEIGSGCYGVVVSKPGVKHVIKICDTYDNSGYLAFLRFAVRNQGNRFFPRIYSIEHFGDSFFVVKMEKLRPQKKIHERWELLELLGSSRTKDARVALRVMNTLFWEHCPDIHCDNIMSRGRQLVIIDPVAE